MQAEKTQSAASGTADTAVRARKRIHSSSRAILPDGERASSIAPATPTTQESLIPDGLRVPAQAFLRAHQPLRFLFDQALMVLAPCAALLGLRVDNPPAPTEKSLDNRLDSIMEETNARTE